MKSGSDETYQSIDTPIFGKDLVEGRYGSNEQNHIDFTGGKMPLAPAQYRTQIATGLPSSKYGSHAAKKAHR